jgi:hypothetical protein
VPHRKTHFEQVAMSVVEKILEQQARRQDRQQGLEGSFGKTAEAPRAEAAEERAQD